MPTHNQYVDFALEFARLAATCKDDHYVREQLLKMAREWMAIALGELEPPDNTMLSAGIVTSV